MQSHDDQMNTSFKSAMKNNPFGEFDCIGDLYSKSFSASWAKSNGVRAVPFRAMQPVTLSNVIAAGRNISSEPRVITTFRLMATCMGIGQAAGITAAHSLKTNTDANEVPYLSVCDAFREKGILL
ncbi:MAG: FAD-dependent oxidoreductase [Victivallales bacterium]